MRQRVMIAMALFCNPTLLFADELTTALDVTIQAQTSRLINVLKDKFGASVMLKTHNLGVIAEICENVAVMYVGYIVEYTDVYTLFSNPLHPYTIGLSKSIPRMNVDVENLDAISGIVSNLLDLPSGCPFHPRCSFCFERCVEKMSKPRAVDNSHLVKCHLVKKKSRN